LKCSKNMGKKFARILRAKAGFYANGKK